LKRFERAAHLRHGILNATLGAVELAASIAIAMSVRAIAVRVIAATDHVLDFLLQRFFHNQPRRELHQLAAIAFCRPTSIE
jgi:hypothetical protein